MFYMLNSSDQNFRAKSILKCRHSNSLIQSVKTMTQQTSLIFTISLILFMPMSKVSCLALNHKSKTSFESTEDIALRDLSHSEDTGTSQDYEESYENDVDHTSIDSVDPSTREDQNIPGKQLSYEEEKSGILSEDNLPHSKDIGTSQDYGDFQGYELDPITISTHPAFREEGQNIQRKELSHQEEKSSMLSEDNFPYSEDTGTSQDYEESQRDDVDTTSIFIDPPVREGGQNIPGKELPYQEEKSIMSAEDNLSHFDDTGTSQDYDEPQGHDMDTTSISIDPVVRGKSQNIQGKKKYYQEEENVLLENRTSNFLKKEWLYNSKIMAIVSTTGFPPKDTSEDEKGEHNFVLDEIPMSTYQIKFAQENGINRIITVGTTSSTQLYATEDTTMDKTDNFIKNIDADSERDGNKAPTRGEEVYPFGSSTVDIAPQGRGIPEGNAHQEKIVLTTSKMSMALFRKGIAENERIPTLLSLMNPREDIASSTDFATKDSTSDLDKGHSKRTSHSDLLGSTVVRSSEDTRLTEGIIFEDLSFYTQGPIMNLNRTLHPKMPHKSGQSDEELWREACKQGSESCIKCKAIAVYCHYNFEANKCFYHDHSHGNKIYECGKRFIITDSFSTFYTMVIVLAAITLVAIVFFAKIFHKYYMSKEPLPKEEVREMRSIAHLIREKRNM